MGCGIYTGQKECIEMEKHNPPAMPGATGVRKTCDIQRVLPEWAKVVRRVNQTPIYNINIFENILSWNHQHQDIPALDYFGYQVTYGELPDAVNEYVCGFRALGITSSDVVTISLPVSIENMLSALALNCIGAISNNVNFLFLKSDFCRYTTDKDSKILLVLDAYLPSIIDGLEVSGVETVIVTSLFDYLPEDKRHLFADFSRLPKSLRDIFDAPQKQEDCRQKMAKMQSVRFVPLGEVRKLGRQNWAPLERGPVDIDRDICYSYTSGTTGLPKCIVYKELSANAFIEMHAGLDTKDLVGERVFQLIPLTHATGERVSGYLPLAKGKTLVPQPIYNKDTFAEDLMNTRCNWVVATPSFYLSGVAKGLIAPDALKLVTRPSSGGEPVTKACVQQIDEWLKMNGCNVRFAIGGGASEDGSGTLFTYFMDEATKTNETGHPIKPFILAKIVDGDGRPVPKGQRGALHISSPAAADRYFGDAEATAARWYVDKDGIRWGVTGDIAVQNPDESYNVLGRASDSYVDSNGKTVFLFDIEYALEATDPVIEWEITAHKTAQGHAIVGQVVLKPEYRDKREEVVHFLCKKYHLDGVKFYDSFEISDVTAKRDYQKLKQDKRDYLAPMDNGGVGRIDFPTP